MCTGKDAVGTLYTCSGTTTGMSGLTDSPSDEKLETLRATPFLSCFLRAKKDIDTHLVLNIRRRFRRFASDADK